MKVTFWGVRGSIPSPLVAEDVRAKLFAALKGVTPEDLRDDETLARYLDSLPLSIRGTVGGNTSCVEVTDGETEIIIDAGSGIRNLGRRLLSGPFGQGRGTAHLLISHFHWDHIQGLPFFHPIYIAGNRLCFYSPRRNFREILERQQNDDNFPVTLNEFRADLEFTDLDDREELVIGGIKVTCIKLNHPGDSFAYRLESPSGTLVYATDSEYESLRKDRLEEYTRFFSRCDALIFDSMFTPQAAHDRKGWGHSTALTGVRIALKAQARRLVLYHHEPNYDDAKIERISSGVKEAARACSRNGLEVVVAYEGLTLEV